MAPGALNPGGFLVPQTPLAKVVPGNYNLCMTERKALSSTEVCRQAGVTYRQLDYWVRKGYVTPSLAVATGSGTHRRFSLDDLHDVLEHKKARDWLRRTAGAVGRPPGAK